MDIFWAVPLCNTNTHTLVLAFKDEGVFYSYCDCGDTCDAARCCCKTETKPCEEEVFYRKRRSPAEALDGAASMAYDEQVIDDGEVEMMEEKGMVYGSTSPAMPQSTTLPTLPEPRSRLIERSS